MVVTRAVLVVLGSLAVLLVFTSACQALHDRWFAWAYESEDRTTPVIRIVERRRQP